MESNLDVSYVAHLARLELTSEESQKFQEQLGHILDHVNQLQKVDISKVPEHPVDPNLPTNALRKDEVQESLPIKEALKNAPQKGDDLVIMPRIVE